MPDDARSSRELTPAFSLRPLESALFGCSIAACSPSSPDEVSRALAGAQTAGCALVVARAPTSDMLVIHEIERRGGLLCDLLVTLTKPLGAHASPNATSPSARVRPATEQDTDAVVRIAGRSFDSFMGHWHADPRLSPTEATELYVRWARDLVRGTGDELSVLVAEADDAGVLGFLALRHHRDGRSDVPLTAVDPSARGQRLLEMMLRAAEGPLARRGQLHFDYETQLSNAAALRAVLRAGFTPSTSRATFHVWLTDPPVGQGCPSMLAGNPDAAG